MKTTLKLRHRATARTKGRNRILAGSVALLAALFLPAPEAGAVAYYWDVNGSTAGFSTVTGAWNGTNSFWDRDSAGTAGPFVAAPISADDLNITAGTAGTITISGTGTGSSLTISDNVAITITGGALALGGTGASSGLFVTGADNAATTVSSAVTLNTGAVTVQNAGTGVLTLSGGVTGAQNLILNNNGATNSGITLATTAVNNTGTITNSGTGAGATLISAAIGSNVTQIIENSATSQLNVAGLITPNAALQFINNSTSGSSILNVTGGISGASNIVLKNNSAIGANTAGVTTGGVTLNTISNTGTVTNSGTGAGTVVITGIIGTTITALNQSSTTSTLILEAANLYSGPTTIAASATLQLGNQSVNSLILGSGSAISNSGTLIFAPGTTALSYGNVITQGATGVLNVNGTTASSPASITLTGLTSNIGGSILLNQGRLIITSLANLGNTATPITINGSGSNGGQFWANAAILIANPIIFNGSAGPVETLGNLGSIRGSNGAGYTGAWTLNAGNSAINPDTANIVTISGPIGGVGTLVVGTLSNNRGGTLVMAGTNNSYSGGTQVSGATLSAVSVGALGTGPVTLNNFSNTVFTESIANALTGTNSLIVNGGTATLSLTNNFTGGVNVNGGTLAVNASGALGANNLVQTGGTVTQSLANAFTSNTALNLSGGTTTLSFANNYSGGANISGTNVTTVSAAGGLNGATNVTGGTLISSLTTGAANNGSVIVSGGLLTSALAGGQFQNVALSGTGTINPGGVGTIGTVALTLNGLSTTGGKLQFDILSTSSYDQISSTGALNIGAGTPIDFSSSGNPVTAGNYKLIQYAGAAPGLGNFTLPGAPTGLSYTLSTGVDAGFIDLVITGSYAAISGNWLPTVTPGSSPATSWNVGTNWSGGTVPKFAGDTANFNSALAGAQNVTVDGQQHVGTLTLNPSTGFAYTINQGTAGSTIYMDNGASAATLQNLAQNNTIAAPINLVSANTNVNVAAGTTLTLAGTTSGTGKLTMAAGTGTLILNGTGAWTGGTEIDSGTVAITATGGTASQINNAGNGLITLNGGTLSFTATIGTTIPPAGFAINVGASGGTLNVAGTGVAGKLLLSGLNPTWLTGSGTLTKNGGGDLQISTPSIGFTGNVVMNGLSEIGSVAALGFGTTSGFNGGTLTVGAGGEVANTSVQIFNPVTLAGGTLSANGSNAIFNSVVNVTGSSTLASRPFQTPTNSQPFAISTLTGSGDLSVIGGTTTFTLQGLVAIGNASGYTGSITIGANGGIGIGNSSGGNFFGNSNAISASTVSSAVGLLADGNGTSTPETISFTLPSNPINFAAGNTGGYFIGRQGATTQFNQAANKTITIAGALPFNNPNYLTITPLNGYGLLLTAPPALTATTIFSVGGSSVTFQPSNVVPGLTLQNLTGGFGIVKSSPGTLLLSGGGNTFGGAGALIDIQGGFVQAATDAALGNAANGVRLNISSAIQGFRASGTFSTGRTFTLNVATNDIEVSTGNTLTITSGLNYAATTNLLTKADAGTLVLTTAAAGAPTSTTNVTGGTLQVSNSNQVGTGAIAVTNAGSSLALTGGGTFTQGITLGNSGSVGISGTVGALTNLAGATTVSGTITVNGGTLITNQDAANTFTLGVIANTITGFNTGGTGNITVTGIISGSGFVNAAPGAGVLRVTAANFGTGNFQALGGTLTLSGAGTSGGPLNVGYGGILNYDNSGTDTPNRNNNHTNSFASGGGGTIRLIGNAGTNSSEQFLTFITGRGEDVVSVTPGAGFGAFVTLTNTGGTFTRNPLASVVYQAPGLGSALAAGVGVINEGVITNTGFQGAFVTGGQPNQQIQPWALAYNTSNPASATTFATASAATAANYRPLAASEVMPTFVNLQGYAGSAVGTATVFNTTTINVTGSTAGLFVGESVSGNGIPANAYITAVGAGNITLNTPAFLGISTSGVVLTYGTAGANISATSPISLNGNTGGNAGTLSPAANSLTLATGGSLTLGNTQTLTLGGTSGGGILATDTTSGNTISGGGSITAGANELDIHTVGNLTISTAITGTNPTTPNPGITKGESGTLTLTGKSYAVGQTVVNAGTLSLNGGNNTIRFANYTVLGAGATLNLNGNAQQIIDLLSDSQVLSGLGTVGGNFTVTGTAGGSLVLVRDAFSRNYTGSIQGQIGLAVSSTGAATWTLTQNQTYSGPTLIMGGTMVLQNAAALSNTSSIAIRRGTLALDDSGSQALAARVPASTSIALAGGTISLTGRSQTTEVSTLGNIALTEGVNGFTISQPVTGGGGTTLALGTLTRSPGAVVNFSTTSGALGTIGSNPLITFSGGANTNNIIGGAYTVNGTDFAAYNATYGVGALGTTGNAGYSPYLINNAGTTDNVSMSTGTGVNLNSQTINSLRVTGATTIGFNAGQTLTLASGGLLNNNGTSIVLTIGSAVNNGSLTSGGAELFIFANINSVTTINSAIVGTGMALVKSGLSNVTLNGTNSYTGGTYVNQGTLSIGATGQLGTGGIFLNGGTLSQLPGGVIPNQIGNVSGSGMLTLVGNNTLTQINFNNNGGTTNPTITSPNGVVLTLTGPGVLITAASSNPATTSTIGAASTGTLDFGNAATPTITVSPIQFNGQNITPLQPTLNINSAIQNSNNPLLVTGGGGLQLSSTTSTFSGGVTLAAGTDLMIGASSVNAANGTPLTGPLGSGTLTLLGTSTLAPDAGAARVVGNNVVVNGNFNFDARTIAAASLQLGVNSSTISLPAATAVAINVGAPNMTGILGGTVTGAGSSIVKNGLGTLTLTNGVGGTSTFSGGVSVNSGTLIASGVGASGTALGTGAVTINGGILALRHSGQTSNSVISYGNNVTINGTLANAFIDVNNNGANTGNTIVMGTLGYTGFTGGNPAPGTLLNVTGGNSYRLQFTGTTLTGATTSPQFNVGAGLTLLLPGGFNVGTNLPTNIGAGTLAYSGTNTGAVAASPITGTVAVAPLIAQSSTPLGTGGITISGGGTLQITPLYSSAISAAGYTGGGMTAKYYFTGQTTMANAANFGIAPNSTLAGVQPNDSLLRQAPVGVNNTSLANTLSVYQGLLNVTTGGTYYVGGGSDEQIQISVDGQLVQNDVTAGHGFNQQGLQPITLAAGQHSVVVRTFNLGGPGSVNTFYSGPDTGANGITGIPPVGNLQALPLSALSYSTGYTAANGYQNAAILNNAISVAATATGTIDGLGTDFNYAIPSLTLGAASTLVVANGTGTAGSMGNGVFVVTGTTNVTAGSGTLNQTTGTLVLAGGVTDAGAGLTKTGAGNLILGGSAGTFTGPFNINGGFVQLADGAGLTTGTTNIGVATTTSATLDLNGQTVTTSGVIVINGGAGPAGKSSATGAGLYNSSATTAVLPAGVSVLVGAATSAVNASIGGFGDIIINGSVQDSVPGSALNKVGPDTLTLNGGNLFTGALNITGGKVVIGNTDALGSNTGGVALSAGAALDLNGFAIGAEPLTLNGAGNTTVGAANTLGSLINSAAGPASFGGTINLGSSSSIGGPSLTAGVNGSITLSGAITGSFVQITKVGGNNLTLTAGAGVETFIDVQGGSLTFSGAGTQSSTNSANFLRPGATMTLDNTGTAVSSRMGGRGLWLSGNLVINGNAGTAVSEAINQGGNSIAVSTVFANGFGGGTITLNSAGTAGVTLQVASTATSIFSRAPGGTLFLRGDSLGQIASGAANSSNILGSVTSLGQGGNNGQSAGQAGVWNAPNALIYPWAVADSSATGVGTGFAGYNSFSNVNFGTANTFGVAPISNNTGNGVATPATLSTRNANTTTFSATITVGSTADLFVGQLVAGTGIPANSVVTAILSGTTFTISANASATANNTLEVYANPTASVVGTTNGTTTVTVASTAGLYPGEVVSGVGISSGTVIVSVTDATHYVLSAAAAVTGTNTLIYSNAGYANLLSTSASIALGSATAAQEVNSISLNNASGATATITTGLQLDSGGILAVGTNAASASYTISGAALTSTGLNKELIFHVTGSGTTLTVNAPIFTSGGLTKADGGTLMLSSKETYTGETTINGGTLQLNGGDNTIFKGYSTPPTAGNSSITLFAQNFTVDNGATLDLNGTTQAVGSLRSGSAVPLQGGTIINSNATQAATLHVMTVSNSTWAGNLSNAGGGILNFVRDGNNTMVINSPQTLSGSVTLTGGATTLVDLGTFQNATSVTVSRSVLVWSDTGVQAVSNRLPSSAPIMLNGGGIQFLGRAGTGATPVDAISLGTLNLGIGESDIVVGTVNQGGATQVTFAGIGTRATGSTLNFGNSTFNTGDNPRVMFTAAPTLSNGIIGAWATAIGYISSSGSSNAGFATYDPASGVRILQYQPNATYGSGVNTMLTANATIPAATGTPATTTVNSLSIYNPTTASFVNATDTLVVQSGGILAGTDPFAKAIGSAAIPGQVQSGAGNDLYVHVGAGTLTINAKILDNGSNNNLIVDGISTSSSGTLALTNANTYGGTTYVSGAVLNLNSSAGPAIPGNVVLSGGNNAATDSLAFSATSLSFSQSNQLPSTASITMNGQTQLNLGFGNTNNVLTGNNQAINNLTINNDAGMSSSTLGGPSVFTGTGTLTINGTLTSTNITEVATIAVINGFLNLTTGNIVVDANQYVAGQIGLAINANITAASGITKTGLGYLGIGGQSMNFTGAFNLNNGGLAFSGTVGTAGPILGGQVIMAANTTVDARGNTGVFGSIVSTQTTAVLMNGLQGTAGTIFTGFDNSNASFAGTISSPFLNGLLNVTKIGAGTWTLTNDSTATNSGTLTVHGGGGAGGVTVGGASGKISFTTTTLTTGGTLLVDDSASAVNNRLGNSTLTPTAAVLAPTYRTLNMQGGNLTVNGNSIAAVNEGIGNINSLGGGGIITLVAASKGGVNVTIGQISGQGQMTSLLIRGDGLGTTSAAAPNVATVLFTTAGAAGTFPGLTLLGSGVNTNGVTNKSIRPDILVDASATGVGSSFLTVDGVTGFIRALNPATELAPTLTTATVTNTNVSLSSVAFGSATSNTLLAGNFAASVILGSLTLQSGGGVNLAIVPTNPWGANGGLLSITPSVGGILNIAGSNSITAGQVASAGVTTDYQIAAGTLTLTGTPNGTNGITKAGAGTLILNTPQINNTNAITGINGGTLQFGANLGVNPLWVFTNATVPNGAALAVNNGTLDLNGNSQLAGTLTTTNPLPFSGGTVGSPNSVITNSSATAATFSTNAAATTIGTVFSGNLSLEKSGNTTMTLSSPQIYTGTTTIRGGTLSLRDSGAIASAGAINIFFGTLQSDNSGLSDSTTRINSAAPVTLSGGAIRLQNGERVETVNLSTVTLAQGISEINVNGYNSSAQTSSTTLNIGNLVQGTNATLNFTAANSGGIGASSAANQHIFLTQLNGVPFNASSMVNGIIAPWMTVNQGEWATYSNANGISVPSFNGTANYSSNALTAGGPTDNITVSGFTSSVVGVTARTINSLAVRATVLATAIGLNGPLDQLVIGSGGVLLSPIAAVQIQGGSITAGALNSPSTLYLNSFGSSFLVTINSPIVNNGAALQATGNFTGGTGALSLVRAGNGIVTLTPQVVESVAFAANAPASTSLTVPNSIGLFVGMGVSGTLITGGSTITAIAANVLTLSAATTANGFTAATNQIAFAAPASAATSTTIQGSTTVITTGNAYPTGFTPTIGMAVGGPAIPGGTTLSSFTGTNATGFTFTLSQAAVATSATAVVTVGAISEGFTGPVITSGGSLSTTGGTLNLTGVAGAITVPGDLTINNSTVVMNTSQGQIAANSNVRLNGGAVLTLTGTNWLNNTVTFNNAGGTATPTVNVGTLLDIAATSAINATNDNTAFTPTITGTALNFSSPTGTTITVAGNSPDDLIISAAITTNVRNTTTGTGAAITKAGTGSLVLPNGNAASLNWILNGGTIIVNNATSLGTNAAAGALTITGNGTLMSGNSTVTIALPITFNAGGNLTLGNSHTVNQVTLSGGMNLNGAAPTFTVAAQVTTDTITGQIIGTGGFTKAGAGALTLTPGTASTFTGPVTLTGGLLTVGAQNALNMSTTLPGTNLGADVTVGAAAEINGNGFAQSFGSLAGGGIFTNGAGALVALTIGSGSNATNATFNGALVAATAANLSLIKTGTNNQTLSGQSYYTGVTTVTGGTLTLKNGSTAATTPTFANTAITVAAGQTLAVSAAGANVGTSNMVAVGNTTTTAAGASLILSAGVSASNFTMADGLIGTFNILQGATYAGSGLTIGSAGAVAPILTFDLNATQVDTVNVAKTVSVGSSGGRFAFNVLPGTSSLAPAYTFINASGGLGTAGLTLPTTNYSVGGHTYAGSLSTSTSTAEILTMAQTSTLANAYWDGAQGTSWNTYNAGATNWSSTQASVTEAGVLPAFLTNVFFTVNNPPGAGNLSTTLGEDFTINSLNFLGTGTSATIPAGIGGGNTLTLNAAPVNGNVAGNGISIAAGSGAVNISTNVVLGASQTWTNNSANALTISGASVTGSGSDLTVTGSGNTAISAAINTGAGALIKNGSGILTLSGNSNYTGATLVTQGTLEVTANNALGTTANGTTVSNGAVLKLTGVNYTTGEAVSINGTGISGGGALVNSGTSTFAGLITVASNATINAGGGTLTLTGGILKNGTTLTVAGGGTVNVNTTGISGASANSDLVVDATTFVLNTASSYNGPTTVQNSGILKLGAGNVLPTAPHTALTLNTGGSLDINGFGGTVASVDGTGTVTNGGGLANALTVGGSNGSGSFAGLIQDGTGGMSLAKFGTGTLTLSSANTYGAGVGGLTTVADGILNVTNTTGSATGVSTVVVDPTGTLAGTGHVAPAANKNINISGVVSVGDATLGSPVGSNLELATTGSGSTLFNSGSILRLDILTGAGLGDNSAISSEADQLKLGGNVTFSSGSLLQIFNPNSMSGWASGDRWRVLDWSMVGTITGSYSIENITLPTLTPGLMWDTTDLFTTAGALSGTIDIVGVPEPGNLLIGVFCGLSMALLRRRTKKIA